MELLTGVATGKHMGNFREFLEGERTARSLTIPEFADLLGIGDSTLRTYIRENNPQIPSGTNLLKVAQALNMTPETLAIHLDPQASARLKKSSDRLRMFEGKVDALDDEQAEAVLALIETMLAQNKRRKK